MKRDATQTIWRTVVFAGAMLGAPACSKKQAQTTPSNTAQPAATDAAAPATSDNQTAPDEPAPGADPCSGEERPRGSDEDGGGGIGRGFVLS